MLIGTILYTLLATILELLMKACTFVANQILDESIVTFSPDTNIFERFVSLIPFADNFSLAALIKGIAIGLVVILVVIAAIKSFTAPISGEDSPNLIQVVMRAALSIILIIVIFGTNFGKTSQFNGILSLIGSWFGRILSYIEMSANTIDVEFVFDRNPSYYVGYLLLLAALVTQVVSAAITILERYISLGISVICGPIMVAMYTSPETKDTTKNWALSIFTQFLAIFLSMFMWMAFIYQANKAFGSGSIFELAVAIVILTMVRNSEKILNTFGLRTLSVGDSARAITGGFALASGAFMVGSRVAGMAGRFKTAGTTAGVASAYSKEGAFGGDAARRYATQTSNVLNSARPISSTVNAVRQNSAIKQVQSAMSNHESISAKTMNQALGLSSKTDTQVIGNGPSSVLKEASATNIDGNRVQGYMGNVSTNSFGNRQVLQDAFIPTDSNPQIIQNGTSVGLGSDGKERFIDGGPIIDNNGNQIYKTTTVNPDVNYKDLGGNLDASENFDYKANEKTIVSETEYPAKN